jgi:hypothetical protein
MRCVRCVKNEALTPDGYCDTCLTAVRTEVEFGWLQLREYLARWAEFAEWCSARGLASV